MKALTVKQPWASLIIHYGKDIENRDWCCTYRGRIAITSSAQHTAEEWLSAWELMAARKCKPEGLGIPHIRYPKGKRPKLESILPNFEAGVILGTVEIVRTVSRLDSPTSPWYQGPYGIVLRDPRPLTTPIPVRGQLGLFDLPPMLSDLIAEEARR